jgi:hypothetical protein
MRSLSTIGSIAPFIFVCAMGCARSTPPAQIPETLSAKVVASRSTTAASRERALALRSEYAVTELRKPGDYAVYRFSGAFRKTPLLLTQKVVRVEGMLVTIDVKLSPDAPAKSEPANLRVVFDRTPGAVREVAKVIRIEGEREELATLEDYEKLMAETVLVPDRNDEMIGTEVVSTRVGDKTIDCKKTSYKVAFGKKTAVMSTLTSEGFAWGDVGGEITGKDGKLIYRAEVVELGGPQTRSASR